MNRTLVEQFAHWFTQPQAAATAPGQPPFQTICAAGNCRQQGGAARNWKNRPAHPIHFKALCQPVLRAPGGKRHQMARGQGFLAHKPEFDLAIL
ncbi:MAG: hypothetical protein MUE77_09430 [Sandarakinorhabdus sp.]|nr:hypothetical protein [Sandarakinorhabdus sp.]